MRSVVLRRGLGTCVLRCYCLSQLGFLLLWWNTVTESQLGRKGFVWLTSPHLSPSQKKSGWELKQGWNLETDANTDAMEGCCFPACSLWLARPPFRTQNHWPSDGAPQQAGPSHICYSRECAAGLSVFWGRFQLRRSPHSGDPSLCHVGRASQCTVMIETNKMYALLAWSAYSCFHTCDSMRREKECV